ncbi:hypothetical protein FT663_02146 [Candidozyma haemuli var. vulneris]|uniref:6-phosphofructo-2-kinase domain-containing protein n=1 Tax=Candidozyma haemuli TaxID=45357 RepID=A0A2V1ALC9_9ASCO|nr:hypothetical protein CXQ85_001160 [[Candida] haemuloni]KAF3990405.1 hypothetical protein FT662_02299 [[Candida] haemuloni var. vulneris]KAF3992837.1 hypothetical protein FT663_02146 [[Candida] haemuloni var. vulneris]PVH18870.1 hypothetical protein CXQ85_001160 [[Candida] haemuloni]
MSQFSEDESELFNGFGSAPLSRNPSQTGRRTKKRWSFHNNSRPNLVEQPATFSSGRRLSDVTGMDGVHKEIDPYHISPAQLYSTESGRLFHAGKICIALAGLPGRGKTHLSVSLTRYLRWLGVKTHSFHLGDYRRATAPNDDLDQVLYMSDKRGEDPFKNKTVDDCLNDILNFFKNDKGQVAIYDAVNALPEHRQQLHEKFASVNIQCIFIESVVTNESILMKNMETAARSSPDYENWNYEDAYKDYSARINSLTPFYKEMDDVDQKMNLSYIKIINFGERIELHNSNYGYLINKVVFFLMNSRIKSGSVFFARCYKNDLDYSKDPPLDEAGYKYAKNLTRTLTKHLASKGRDIITPKSSSTDVAGMRRTLSTEDKHPPTGADGLDDDSFVVWTSVKRRTIEACQFFREMNVNVRHRIQLSQKNPGIVAGMSDEEIQEKFPSEYEQFLKDPYHHRFSRSESYHDLAIKIEPLILEMERMSGDILIIADETVLRVFHGYLMACSCYDIPSLEFNTNEIIEVKFSAYSNSARRIPIENFD